MSVEHLLWTELINRGQPFITTDDRLYYIVAEQPGLAKLRVFGQMHGAMPGPTLKDMARFYAYDYATRCESMGVNRFNLYEIAPRLIAALGDSKLDAAKLDDTAYLDSAFAAKGVTPSIMAKALPESQIEAASEANARYMRRKMLFNNVTYVLEQHSSGGVQLDDRSYAHYEEGLQSAGIIDCIKQHFGNPKVLPDEQVSLVDFDAFSIGMTDGSVRLKIPPYVLRDYRFEREEYYNERKVYVKMPAMKIGVQLGRVGDIPMIVCFEGNGPFVGAYSKVCIGEYSTAYFSGMPYADALTRYLLEAKKIMLTGYRDSNVHPHREAVRCGSRINEDQIRAEGLRVTNDSSFVQEEKASSIDDVVDGGDRSMLACLRLIGGQVEPPARTASDASPYPHTAFVVRDHHRYDLRDWLRHNFPFLENSGWSQPSNLQVLEQRAGEIQAACNHVESIDVGAQSSYIGYYDNNWTRITRAVAGKDYTTLGEQLRALLDAIEVE